jgi:pimeloyl-ACP methyl ester carboxylesterase
VIPLLVASPADAATAAQQCTSATPSLRKANPIEDDRDQYGQTVKETPLADGSAVPVIVVHGWTGRSIHNASRSGNFSHLIDMTANRGTQVDPGRSLIGVLQDAGGAAVYSFDYHDASSRWVSDSAIGPKLRDAITCLAGAYSHPVILVTHSMGGLAARFALGLISQEATVTSVVSDVVTYGTPNTGSWLSAAVNAADTAAQLASMFPGAAPRVLAAVRALLTLCGTVSTQSMDKAGACGLLGPQIGASRSAAAKALANGSDELAKLATWPDDVRVHALAGTIDLEILRVEWFGRAVSVGTVDLGDMVVGSSSARQTNSYDRAIKCGMSMSAGAASYDKLLEGLKLRSPNESRDGILTFASTVCYHGNLMRSIELGNDTLGVVVDAVDAANSQVAFPEELAGEWCSRDGSSCFSLTDTLARWPTFSVQDVSSGEAPGTTRFSVCFELDLGDGCTTAAAGYYDYFPVGVGWDCNAQAEMIGRERCAPNFTNEHDSSLERLKLVPNHQQGEDYWDSPPMYRR